MKRYLIGLIVVLLCLTGCASTAGYEYMNTVEVSGDAGLWETKYYVDNFKNPTDEAYITTTSIGTFTNSATNGSELIAKVIVNENNVEVELLEYGSYPINIIGNSLRNVKINFDGQTVNLGNAWFDSSTKRLLISNKKIVSLFQALVEHEKVTMYITIDNYGRSTYLFDIYSAGFEYNYKEAFLK